jgi:SulP family sulfate permease
MSTVVQTKPMPRHASRETIAHHLVSSLITSVVVSMMTVVMSVSFVALIFIHPLGGFVGVGTSLMLLMAAILGVVMALLSSYPGTIAIPQDRVAPIVALMVTFIIRAMPGAPPEQIGMTVLAAIALTTVSVGGILFLLGAGRLGSIVRFTPYPVIGGFLAGSGWLLLTGSFRVMTGRTYSLLDLGEFLSTGALQAWLPCMVFGLVAYVGVRFSRHYLMLPALVLAASLGFYAWLGFSHPALDAARAHGWLLAVPADAGMHDLLVLPALPHANWFVVFAQYPSFIALLLTSIISILLNTSALELATDEEIDLNRELRAAGMANVLGGFACGMVGFQSLTLSSLAVGMGVRSRLVGLISAGACLALLIFGTAVLGYIPKFILGGILVYTGLAFLTEWIFDAYFRLTREDYFVVVLILAVVAVAGYLQGVGTGIIVATLLFVFKYSSVNVISSVLSGESHHSTVDRSPVENRLLHTVGGQIYILRLKGFIFFGSADKILQTIRERDADPAQPRLAYVILDFQQVSGLDTSGIVSVQKLVRLAERAHFIVLAASVPVDIQNSFRHAGLIGEGHGKIRLFRDRDFSIEWCENAILQPVAATAPKPARGLAQILQDLHPWKTDTSQLLTYLQRMEVDKNHYLMLQNDPSDELFFIESGRVRVVVELDNGRTMRLRTMEPGTVVGEIGLYLSQPRLASVVTEEPSVVYRLDAKALEHMGRDNPALASAFHEFMVRVLAERVAQQNNTLRALVE